MEYLLLNIYLGSQVFYMNILMNLLLVDFEQLWVYMFCGKNRFGHLNNI